MTTIAYKDGVLAADTTMTKGSAVIGKVVKIRRNTQGHLAGASGSASFNRVFLDWFSNGEEGPCPDAIEKDDAMDRGLIFRHGRIELYEPGAMFTVTADYFAVGSGCDFAIGAMHAGAGAEQAVMAAIEHDPNTRGPITVLRVDR